MRNNWTVSNVQRDPSGRAMSLIATRSGCEVCVVVLYMPSGLDWEPTESKKRLLTESLYNFASKAVAGHKMFLIGGDLNETRSDSLDRRVSGDGTAKNHRRCNIESSYRDPWGGAAPTYLGHSTPATRTSPDMVLCALNRKPRHHALITF